jgi:flagellar assembly protein FliH
LEVATQTRGSRKTTAATESSEGVSNASEILAQRESVARETGRREGEAATLAASEQRLAQVRSSVDAALAGFARDRAQYYQQVETEVVQLALAIARKILHREAQIDPMLLAGMVRITLEKIESATKVMVRVHPQQVSECRSYFAQHMEASQVPDVVEDAALQKDHCLLQTALGTTEVGVDLQLKEIEQGLFDLLAKRPASV